MQSLALARAALGLSGNRLVAAGVIALVLAAAAFSAYLVRRRPTLWVQVLIWVLVLQNAVVIAFWRLTGSTDFARGLLYSKEGMVAGAALAVAPALIQEMRIRKPPRSLWLAIAFLALCALYIPISLALHEPVEQIARGLRFLTYPVALALVAYIALRAQPSRTALVRTLWLTAILLGASAVIERQLVPVLFYFHISIVHYWVDVKGVSRTMLGAAGLPWNMFLRSPGALHRRAFGIMSDSLALSYYLLLPWGLTVADIARRRRLSVLPVLGGLGALIGIGFSVSRVPIVLAAIIALAVPVAIAGFKLDRRTVVTAGVAGLLAIGICLGGYLTAPTFVLDPKANAAVERRGLTFFVDPSTSGHLNALGSSAKDFGRFALGTGLGSSGPLSSAFVGGAEATGFEDVYLDVTAQIGLLGGALLAGFGLVAALTLVFRRQTSERRDLAIPVGIVFAGLLVVGVLSSQLLVLTSLGPTWLALGAAIEPG